MSRPNNHVPIRLTPTALLSAYAHGIFPMAHSDGQIYFYDPDPRAIIPLDDRFHVSRRLERTIKKKPYEIRFSTDFEQVMRRCAAPNIGRETTWISDEIVRAYTLLNKLGYAHSVEAWQDGSLVGGLYGVTLGGLFAGESMFSVVRDASKICLVHLVERLRERGYVLLDTQYQTRHLSTFGAIEMPNAIYRILLQQALQMDVSFLD